MTGLAHYFHHRSGVQVCAELGELPALNSLTRTSIPGLLLQAGWSSAAGFTLDIVLPTPSTVNLGRGITTDPFKLRIETKPPMLELIAGIKIPVPKQSEPLDFVSLLFLVICYVLSSTVVMGVGMFAEHESFLQSDRGHCYGAVARLLE